MNAGHVACLRALAALLRTGVPLTRALLGWPDEAPSSPEVRLVATRVSLGVPAAAAVTGTAFDPLADAFRLHLSHGIDLARWLEATTDRIEQDLAAATSARAAAAGAILSGRMVAGLPLLFVPLVPMSRAALLDGPGLVLLLVGIALAVIGLRWIGRLLPSPPPPDRAATLGVAAAALLDAGLGVDAALAAAVAGPGERSALERLRALGWTTPAALARVDPVYEPVCAALDRCRLFGLPAAEALRSMAAARRAAALRDFDRRVARAPVLMVVPLTCCVLPAYGLLGVAPFLRSIGLNG